MSYPTHIFAGNLLDRGDKERRDEDLIRRLMQQDNARILPFHDLKPLVRRNPHAELAWISNEFLQIQTSGYHIGIGRAMQQPRTHQSYGTWLDLWEPQQISK